MVNEDVAHGFGGYGVELDAVAPLDVGAGEPQVRFVDQGSGAQGVARALAGETARSESFLSLFWKA